MSYDLSQGPKSEQELYDQTTDYIRYYYNRARVLNRSAARLAMSVFQRRLASSTYALMRSFERRKEKLEGLIADIRNGRLTEEQLAGRQRRLDKLDDVFETRTADEEAASEGREQHEDFESEALGGTVAVNLSELESERLKVEALLDKARNRLTVHMPTSRENAVWIHPGEPVFDSLSASILGRFGRDGLKGAVFVDPFAPAAYLFHLALVSVEQDSQVNTGPTDLSGDCVDVETAPNLIESRLIGLRQSSDGTVEECPVEHLLLLRGGQGVAPSRVPLATLARGMVADAANFAREEVTESLVQSHRQRRLDDLPSRLGFVNRGFDFQAAEFAAARARLSELAHVGDRYAKGELSRVKARQRSLTASRTRRLAELRAEADHIRAGEVEFLVHALVVPAQDPKEVEHYHTAVEAIALKIAAAYEESYGAKVKDVSRPDLARSAGLTDWPGFDLLSVRSPDERRAVEVKGRAGTGAIELSENEWAKACNLRDGYWLYVVYDCATPRPRLQWVRDPFGRLLARSRESTAYTIPPGAIMEVAE